MSTSLFFNCLVKLEADFSEALALCLFMSFLSFMVIFSFFEKPTEGFRLLQT